MKNQIFFSAWNDYPARLDVTITRARAAALIRSWRRNSMKKTNNAPWVCKLIAPHTYFVKVSEWDRESHTLITR